MKMKNGKSTKTQTHEDFEKKNDIEREDSYIFFHFNNKQQTYRLTASTNRDVIWALMQVIASENEDLMLDFADVFLSEKLLGQIADNQLKH